MKKIKEKLSNLPHKRMIGAVVAILLTVPLPAYAWFSSHRQLGDLQYVDSPTELYITAGNGEDLQYLDLTGIQVTDANVDQMYYVFGVKGSDASGYNLQLAYTTNNQFEYFIYPAKESSADNYLVDYTTHNEDGTLGDPVYYTIDTEDINNSNVNYSGNASFPNYVLWTGSVVRNQTSPASVTAEFLNLDATGKDARDRDAIKANSSKHSGTYGTNNNTVYNNVQDYAEPLYWQVRNIRSDMDSVTKEVMDYYILEVNWKKTRSIVGAENLKNDRETDVIYIAVKGTTVNSDPY